MAPGGFGGGYLWLLVRMLLVLVVVVVFAILVLKYVVPRLGALHARGFRGEWIEVVARRSLEPKRHLWIVKVGKRHFLLGSADGSINPIAELEARDLEAP